MPFPMDLFIIGGGPAGMAAAIQLKRSEFNPVILEKEQLGGLLNNALLVENYPGFPGGISGPELVERMTLHLKELKIKVIYEEVISVDLQSSGKDNKSGLRQDIYIKTENNRYIASHLIIASGTKPLVHSIKLPEEIRHLVFYEARHLVGISGKKIVIIGAGDAAFDYALNLSRENDIILMNRHADLSALPLLIRRAERNRRISYLTDREIVATELKDEKHIRLTIKDGNNKIEYFFCDYLLFAIGREPNFEFISPALKNQLESLAASRQVLLIGDVKNGMFRQASISAGDGIRAGMEITQAWRHFC
ncbi:MAG: NAD(P)/FAD-dependent oxidoreductase [Candidatus Aminicenantes bacterium]|nr:NAD(P)/FAD-dependent oxidoreductase [Candidatus Aminicenantes bacterium]